MDRFATYNYTLDAPKIRLINRQILGLFGGSPGCPLESMQNYEVVIERPIKVHWFYTQERDILQWDRIGYDM